MEEVKEARWINVGGLRIIELPDGSHWIGDKDGGEGGQFKEFAKFVEEFYSKNF